MTKNLLIVINNFPSQFKTALNVACMKNWNVYGICHQEFMVDQYAPTNKIKIIKDVPFDPIQTESNSIQFTNALLHIKDMGIVPDIILVHIGFGIERSCRHLFPNSSIIGYCEWYFGENTMEDRGRRVTDIIKNHGIRNQLTDCDYLISPTRIQRSQYPVAFQRRISILHEGIDTDFWKPLNTCNLTTTKTVTYVSRGLEPTRKFMEFVRGAKLVLKTLPNVRIKIIGRNKVYYSDHKESFLDLARTEFGELLWATRVEYLGDVCRAKVLETFQSSDVHIFFTDIFVPSWSMLEAMSCGCLMVGSDNIACQEFMQQNVNAILTDHSNPMDVKDAIIRGLNLTVQERKILTTNARSTVLEKFNSKKSTQQWADMLSAIV